MRVERCCEGDAVAVQWSEEEICVALEAAIDAAIVKILAQRNVQF